MTGPVFPPQPQILRSLAHWGAFRAEVQDGRLIRTLPFEHDPEPSPFNDD